MLIYSEYFHYNITERSIALIKADVFCTFNIPETRRRAYFCDTCTVITNHIYFGVEYKYYNTMFSFVL